MASTVSPDELGSELTQVNVDTGKPQLAAAVRVCEDLSLTPQEFARRWDRFAANAAGGGCDLDQESLEAFRRAVTAEFAAARRKRVTAVTPRSSGGGVGATGGRYSAGNVASSGAGGAGSGRPNDPKSRIGSSSAIVGSKASGSERANGSRRATRGATTGSD